MRNEYVPREFTSTELSLDYACDSSHLMCEIAPILVEGLVANMSSWITRKGINFV